MLAADVTEDSYFGSNGISPSLSLFHISLEFWEKDATTLSSMYYIMLKNALGLQ